MTNVVTPNQILTQIKAAKEQGQTIVLVTGVFDLLHQEHQIFLTKAKQAGDYLVVAVESDARVRAIKGADRPINTADHRVAAIEALQVADAVFVLPTDFDRPEVRQQLLLELQPDVLAVSSHTAHLDVKRKMMAAIGGQVKIVHQHNPAISTTILLQNKRK